MFTEEEEKIIAVLIIDPATETRVITCHTSHVTCCREKTHFFYKDADGKSRRLSSDQTAAGGVIQGRHVLVSIKVGLGDLFGLEVGQPKTLGALEMLRSSGGDKIMNSFFDQNTYVNNIQGLSY